MPNISIRHEKERGCGFRKKGSLYLVSGQPAKACGKLPFELTVCKCFGQGIKPTRGFAWIEATLIEDAECSLGEAMCDCSLREEPWSLNHEDKLGIMWVGSKFYKTPELFTKEALHMGISKKISQIPRDLKIGETWILLGHRQAVRKGGELVPGVFQAFRPTAIEYIVTGDETDEELERLEKRGFTLVDVIPESKPKDGDLFG